MSRQALYRRWRPQRFGDVVGQEHVTRTLRNAVNLDRVSHGYLFSGPRGVAKTSTARILAKAINCLAPSDGEPCDACELCRAIAQGISYDVIEMDAASNGLVDNVRELRQHVMTHPDQARRKVYILDEAHRMSAPAFDALLKTLEEPPPHVVFVLVTSEPDKIPATIASRCQRFDFRRLAQRGIVGRLAEMCAAEEVEADSRALDLIARAATGSMRDAQSLLDQLLALGGKTISLEDVEAVLGTGGTAAAVDLARHVVRKQPAEGLRLINRVLLDGADPRQFCRDVTDYLRGLLLVKLAGADDALDVSVETLAQMGELAAEATLDQLLRAVKLFGQADAGWRGTLHFQLPLELAFVESTLDPTPPSAVTPSSSAPASPSVGPGARPGGWEHPSPPRPTARPPLARPAPSEPAASPVNAPAAPAPLAAGPPPTAARAAEPPLDLEEDGDAAEPLEQTQLRTGWASVREILRESAPHVGHFLAHVRPRELRGSRLVLEARSSGHQELVKRNLRTLAPATERAFGRSLSISVGLASDWGPEAEEAPHPLDSPLVRAAEARGWRARLVDEPRSGQSVQSPE